MGVGESMTGLQFRVRFVFRKDGPLRYTSHLDLFRAWERALRRAGLPVVYSQGFNPRPKLQIASALPLGHIGEAELVDVWLESPLAVDEIARLLSPVLPAGLSLTGGCEVELKASALQTRVIAAHYRVSVEWPEDRAQVESRIKEILAAEEVLHERRGRTINLRPLILGLSLTDGAAGTISFDMQLSAREGATTRPEAVLEVLGLAGAATSIYRQELILEGLG
jgi:radical SAM-linked protein